MPSLKNANPNSKGSNLIQAPPAVPEVYCEDKRFKNELDRINDLIEM